MDELGWLQFDRLCPLVLEADAGLSDLRWSGRGDTGRVAVVDGRVTLRGRRAGLAGPVTVVAVWVRDTPVAGRRWSELADRVAGLWADVGLPPDGRALVLTNLDRDEAAAALGLDAAADKMRVVVLGAAEISASLDREPWMRATMPSVLGLRDLDELIDPEVRRRSSIDVERAQELARVFWPTHAYERAREVLGGHRFVVLTGPPETGKTAIAEMLALACLTDGWEAHECKDPDDVWRVFDRGRRQVFIADDAFGSTEYRPDSAERWARGLGRLLEMLDGRHWLIWTSRPAPLKAGLRRLQRESGSDRFPAPGEVLVDASDLELADKTLILFRHAKDRRASGAVRQMVRSAGLSIVEHPHFTPERIRRFVADRFDELARAAADGPTGLRELVERELASPTDAMRTSFKALESEHRELLISLLDAPAGLIDELRGDPVARRQFLSVSGVDGVTLAVSRAGGATGERTLPLLITDADWDAFGDRLHELLRELEDRDLVRILLAVGGALGAVNDRAQTRELDSLAVNLLGATRGAWDQRHGPVPVFLLEAWYAINARVINQVVPPLLAPTWAELHPGTLLLEHPEAGELTRTEEWLELAEVLSRYDRPVLEALDFFGRDRDLLERLIVTLTRACTDEDLRPLCESVLARIERLVPELYLQARSAREIGRLVEGLGRKQWWVPRTLPRHRAPNPPRPPHPSSAGRTSTACSAICDASGPLDEHRPRGELGRAGERVQVAVPEEPGVPEFPEDLRVVPGYIAGAGDRPHRDRRIGLLRRHVLDVRDQPGVEPAGDFRLDRRQQGVDPLVVAVDRAVVLGHEPELLTG